jgi:acyl-coenzyme A thioesterase PaaI-like protein
MSFLSDLRASDSVAEYQKFVDGIPYALLLGLSVHSIDAQGCLVTKMTFSPTIIGNANLPAIHGGVIGGFLEMAAIFQLVRDGEGEHLPKPINITVDYLRSAGPRDTFACATITKHGRRVANVRVEAWQDDRARPVAVAHGHFLMPRVE